MLKFEYFPCNVYRDEQPDWVDHSTQVVQKYLNVYMSCGLLDQTSEMVNDTNLNFLKEYLISIAPAVLKEQGYLTDKYDFYVKSLWGQVFQPGASTNVHVHKNSQLCGWFFLKTPENGSYPVYYDPRHLKEMVELDYVQEKQLLHASSQVHFYNINPGTILFSNTWLKHQMSVNNGETETTAIHFIIDAKEKNDTHFQANS